MPGIEPQAAPRGGGCLPTPAQMPLLHACLGEGEPAVAAWRQWLAANRLEEIEPALFRLLPLVWRILKDVGYDGPEMPTLKGVWRRNWYFLNTLTDTLEQTAGTLQDNGIKVVVFKGAAIGKLYYPDPFARSMADLDLLVPPAMADKAMETLQRNGWRVTIPLKADYLHNTHAAHFVNERGQELDLHWHLLHECCGEGDDDACWRRVVPFPMRTLTLLTLSPEDHLLHACVHGLQWNDVHPLRWTLDAHFILRAGPVDWDYILLQAAKRSFSLRLRCALDFLSGELHVPVPPGVLHRLRASRGTFAQRRELAVLTRLGKGGMHPPARAWWELRKAWHLQRRLQTGRGFWSRLLGYPKMLCVEMRLQRWRQMPLAGWRYLRRLA